MAAHHLHGLEVGLYAGASARIRTRDNQNPSDGHTACRTASQMLSTTSATSVSSSPSAITRISGSVPDLRITSRPVPLSRVSAALIACLTPSDSSGLPFAKRTFFNNCGSGLNKDSVLLAGFPLSYLSQQLHPAPHRP